jgi:hypothetical protein
MHTASPIDFVKTYLNLGVLFSNDTVPVADKPGHTEMPNTKTIHYVKKYCEFFCDLCLQEYEFQKFESEILAIAILLCARKGVKVSPVWNPEISRLTTR